MLDKKLKETRSQLEALRRESVARKKAEIVSHKLQQDLNHLHRLYVFNAMFSSVIHQLSQPLGSIQNNVSTIKSLLSQKNKKKEIDVLLSYVLKDCGRTRKVLNKNRGMLKRIDYDFRKIDLNAIIKSVMESQHSFMVMHNVVASFDKIGSVEILGDKIHLEQVINNLIINAVEAMENSHKKELHLSIDVSTPKIVKVCVSDTGVGLNKKIQSNLMMPFFTTKPNGLGMGLPIAATIIKDHQGKLWGSNNTSGGMTFCFTLPMVLKDKK